MSKSPYQSIKNSDKYGAVWAKIELREYDVSFSSNIHSSNTGKRLAEVIKAKDIVQIWVEEDDLEGRKLRVGLPGEKRVVTIWQLSKQGAVIASYDEAAAYQEQDKNPALAFAVGGPVVAIYFAFELNKELRRRRSTIQQHPAS